MNVELDFLIVYDMTCDLTGGVTLCHSISLLFADDIIAFRCVPLLNIMVPLLAVLALLFSVLAIFEDHQLQSIGFNATK